MSLAIYECKNIECEKGKFLRGHHKEKRKFTGGSVSCKGCDEIPFYVRDFEKNEELPDDVEDDKNILDINNSDN